MIGVYKITSPVGKIYIGSSKNIEKRFGTYRVLACKKQSKLYNSLKKYGVKSHVFEVVEECSVEELFEKERNYGERYQVLDRDKGLNLSLPKTTDRPRVFSKEAKENMSAVKKGRKMNPIFKEKISKMRTGKGNPFYGKSHSESTKNKIGKANKGRRRSEESKEHLSVVRSRPILDTQTGVYYLTMNEAAKYLGINSHTLRSQLQGTVNNKTNLIVT